MSDCWGVYTILWWEEAKNQKILTVQFCRCSSSVFYFRTVSTIKEYDKSKEI